MRAPCQNGFSILFLRNDLSIFYATMIKRCSASSLDMNGLNIWKIVFFARIKPTKTGCCCPVSLASSTGFICYKVKSAGEQSKLKREHHLSQNCMRSLHYYQTNSFFAAFKASPKIGWLNRG